MGQPDDAIWDAISSDPAVGVCIIAMDGEILAANDQIATMFLESTAHAITGRNLYELYPKAWADERIAVFQRIVDSGKPAILRHIRRGVQLQSTIAPLEPADDGRERFLTITHRGETHEPDEKTHFEVIESSVVDWGPLDVLSRRELEVLALIKHGLSLPEIAETLHRSKKTIEHHRESIAKKLGQTNRVRLAQTAEAAGLELHDAALERTKEP